MPVHNDQSDDGKDNAETADHAHDDVEYGQHVHAILLSSHDAYDVHGVNGHDVFSWLGVPYGHDVHDGCDACLPRYDCRVVRRLFLACFLSLSLVARSQIACTEQRQREHRQCSKCPSDHEQPDNNPDVHTIRLSFLVPYRSNPGTMHLFCP